MKRYATILNSELFLFRPITLTFEGGEIVAEIMNIMSKFVTAILHPLIEGIIHQIIQTVCVNVVDVVNKVIDHVLHPNSTSFETQLYQILS